MPAVDSSAIDRVEYDGGKRRLDIWFVDSGGYSYRDVPATIYEDLLAASSKGEYFNDHIKDRYEFVRHRARRRPPGP